MDIRSLKYFLSAARHLNFSVAAKACYVTQTAMSLCIAKMESELNFKLFYRTNHMMQLTPAGTVFRDEVQKTLMCYEDAVKRGYSASLGYEGILRIDFPNYLERLFVPKLVKLFHQSYPKIEIILCQNEQWIINDRLKNGECDIALVFPYELEDNEDICIEKMAVYKSCVATSPNHRFAALSKVTVEMLKNETLIIMGPEQMPYLYRRMLNSFEEYGVEVKSFIEVKSIASILALVEAELGIGLMLSYIKQAASQEFVFVDLEDYPVLVGISFAYLRSNDNPALKLFLDIIGNEKNLTPI
jgi:DNA-binding transcriptional LysR family regulator